MSIFGNSGGGGGITPEQLEALVSDGDLSIAQLAAYAQLSQLLFGQVVDPNNPMSFTPIAASLAALSSAAAAPSGLTVLMNRADGQAPAGYTRVSGVAVPAGLYGQQRFVLTSFGTASASSEGKVWTLSSAAGSSRYGDIGTGANTTIANWPGNGTSGLYSVLATDENAYTFGGAGTGTVTASCFRYTLSTNSWAQVANLPAARNSALAAQLADGRMLVIGGLSTSSIANANFTDTVYRYDPAANTWSTMATLPFRSYQGYATRLADGRIFCLFSSTTLDGSTSGGNRAAIYSPDADAWETADTPPFAGPCYQDASGNVVVLSLATPGNAQTYNFAAAAGSRWSSTPYTAPSNAVSLSSAAAFTRPLASGTLIPLSVSFGGTPGTALFTLGTLTSQAGASFYATKN